MMTTITRHEFMELCGETLSEEECVNMFNIPKDRLRDGSAMWTFELEVAYNDFVDSFDDIEEEEHTPNYKSMPCDEDGCAGSSCPRYYECYYC